MSCPEAGQQRSTARPRAERIARGSLAAVGLALAVLIGVGCTSDREKLEQHLAEAEEHQEAERHREAFLALRQALELEPDNARINLELAETLRAMGRPADAAFYYGEAYRLDPTLADAALAQAPLLYDSDLQAARELVEEVLERQPDNHLAHLRRAEIALLETDMEGALEAALAAEELAPEEPASHRIVGTVYTAMVKLDQQRSREPDPSLYESALSAYRRANELAEVSWRDYISMAELYGLWPGHGEERRKAWRQAFAAARDDDHEAGMRAVSMEALSQGFRISDLDLIRWALERRLEVDPDRLRAWRQLAAVAEREEPGAEEQIWRQAVAEQPGDPRFHAAFGRYLASQDRPQEALAHLESLPPELADSAELDLLRVQVHVVEGNLELARGALEEMRARHPQDPRTGFAEARIEIAEGRLEEAAARLRRVSEELERPDVLYLLSQVQRSRGQHRSALDAANRAIELSSVPQRRFYEARHASQKALGDWEGLLRSMGEMRTARMTLTLSDLVGMAQAHYVLGNTARARRILDRLLDREAPPLPAVLAYVRHEGRSDPERALDLLEEALARQPDNGVVVRAMASVELAAGRPERALERLDALGEEQLSKNPKLRLMRARILARLERWERAEEEVRAVLQAEPPPSDSARLLAEILRAQGRPGEAIALLEEARSGQRPLAPQELWLLGSLYLADGDLERAGPVLEEAVSRAPDLHLARNDLAFVLAETGTDLDRALSLARDARSALPERPAVADTLGWVYYKRGLMEPALAEFRSALELAGENGTESLRADIHYHNALALEALDRSDEALRELDLALDLQPEHAGARDARSRIAAASAPDAGS